MIDTLARRLLAIPGRPMVGIAGAPGAGKSTLAARLAEPTGAVIVPMDGFHLSNETLTAQGRLDRKGEPASFDRAGFVTLLRRIRAGEPVRAPAFDRSRECTVPDSIEVPSDRPVIVEGNYLLYWPEVAEVLDEVWFVSVPEDVRIDRLVARHVRYGRTEADARTRARAGSDGDNARLVEATRDRATLVIAQPDP